MDGKDAPTADIRESNDKGVAALNAVVFNAVADENDRLSASVAEMQHRTFELLDRWKRAKSDSDKAAILDAWCSGDWKKGAEQELRDAQDFGFEAAREMYEPDALRYRWLRERFPDGVLGQYDDDAIDKAIEEVKIRDEDLPSLLDLKGILRDLPGDSTEIIRTQREEWDKSVDDASLSDLKDVFGCAPAEPGSISPEEAIRRGRE